MLRLNYEKCARSFTTNKLFYITVYSPKGNRTPELTVKILRLNLLNDWAFLLYLKRKYNNAQYKYCTYFYRLQNDGITFMLTRHRYIKTI